MERSSNRYFKRLNQFKDSFGKDWKVDLSDLNTDYKITGHFI